VQATAHSTGAPCSHQLTWAEKAGRSPSNAFGRSRVRLFIRSEAEGPAVQRTFHGNVARQKSNNFVIPTGAKRSGGTCCSVHPTHQHSMEAPPSILSSRGADLPAVS
jgi:hypothetical protein